MITLSSGIRSKAVVYTRGFGALFIWQAIPQAKWFARTQRFDNVRRTAGTTCRIITLRLRIGKSIGKSMRGPPHPLACPPPNPSRSLVASQRHYSGFWRTFYMASHSASKMVSTYTTFLQCSPDGWHYVPHNYPTSRRYERKSIGTRACGALPTPLAGPQPKSLSCCFATAPLGVLDHFYMASHSAST